MSAIRQLYKELIIVSKRLPAEQQAATLQEIRTTFRQHVNETDPAVIEKLVKQANSRLSFLKMITPKPITKQSGSQSFYVNKEGKLVEGHAEMEDAARLSHWGTVSVDMIRRNEAFHKKLGMKVSHSKLM